MSRVIVASEGSPYRQLIRSGNHTWSADEPIGAGGDAGPSPYELLLSALGACMSITIQMYARRKAWPLEAVEVVLAHEHISAAECSDCRTKEGKVLEIRVQVTLYGNLESEQRQRLVEVARRCPVSRSLQGEIKIREMPGSPADQKHR
ncbi:MAG: OsmC family protein [Acidobacteria bacterium]|nr:OsmC family protein [Acidobacteriota bacterium]